MTTNDIATLTNKLKLKLQRHRTWKGLVVCESNRCNKIVIFNLLNQTNEYKQRFPGPVYRVTQVAHMLYIITLKSGDIKSQLHSINMNTKEAVTIVQSPSKNYTCVLQPRDGTFLLAKESVVRFSSEWKQLNCLQVLASEIIQLKNGNVITYSSRELVVWNEALDTRLTVVHPQTQTEDNFLVLDFIRIKELPTGCFLGYGGEYTYWISMSGDVQVKQGQIKYLTDYSAGYVLVGNNKISIVQNSKILYSIVGDMRGLPFLTEVEPHVFALKGEGSVQLFDIQGRYLVEEYHCPKHVLCYIKD